MASFNPLKALFLYFSLNSKPPVSTPQSPKSPLTFIKSNNYLTYTFKRRTKCLSVDYDGIQIMKFDRNKTFPKSVVFSIMGNTTIFDFGDYVQILRMNNTSRRKPLLFVKDQSKTLNVLYKKDGTNYFCEQDDEVYTYTPKDKRLFSRVRYHPVKGKDQVIFETDDILDMANVVVYDETDDKNLFVTIYHVNGLRREFTRKKSGGKWKECTPEYITSTLSSDKVKFTFLCRISPEIDFGWDNKYLMYKFLGGARCLAVEYDNKELLKFDPTDPFPQSLFFTRHGNRVFLNFKDSVDIIKFDEDGYETIFSGLKQGVGLDIATKSPNCVFDYSKTGKVHTYTAKSDNVFCSVVRGDACTNSNTTIWSPSYYGDCATMVVCNENNSNNTVVEIHGVSGLTRKFRKDEGGVWEECTTNEPGDEAMDDKVEFLLKVKPRMRNRFFRK